MSDTAPQPPSDTVATLHQALVDQLCQAGLIHSPTVESAFRAVPRHLFLPGVPLEQVYQDRHVVTKRLGERDVSSSSQPAVMAIMLEHLKLEPGQQVLEIGAGTGYNAALMAQLVGPTGSVTTVDIDDDLVAGAQDHLAAAGVDNVAVVCGDGALGYAGAAPYDRIMVTVRAPDLLPTWHEQLRLDGRLVAPLQLRGAEQKVIAFERRVDHWVSVALEHAGFLTLRGAFELPDQHGTVQLGPAPGVSIVVHDRAAVDAEAVYTLLNGPYSEVATPIFAPPELYAFQLWLTMQDPRTCWLITEGDAAQQATTPYVFQASDTLYFTIGLVTETSLSVLVRPPTDGANQDVHQADAPAFALWIRGYGQHADLTQQLRDQLAAWDSVGRPGLDRLRIRVYPEAAAAIAAAPGVTITKPWSRWLVDWPTGDT